MMLEDTYYHERAQEDGLVCTASSTTDVVTCSPNACPFASIVSVSNSKASASPVIGETASGWAQSSANTKFIYYSDNRKIYGNRYNRDSNCEADRLLYSGFLEKRTSSAHAPVHHREGSEVFLFELVLVTNPAEQSSVPDTCAGRQECLLRYFEISQAASDCSQNHYQQEHCCSSNLLDIGRTAPDGPWLEGFRGEVVLTTATHVASAISDPVYGLRVFFPCGRALKMKAPTSAAAETWKSALRHGILAARAHCNGTTRSSSYTALAAIQNVPHLLKLSAYSPNLDTLLPKLDTLPQHELHDPSHLFHDQTRYHINSFSISRKNGVDDDKCSSSKGVNLKSSSPQGAAPSSYGSKFAMHDGLTCVKYNNIGKSDAPRIELKAARSLSSPRGDGPALRRQRTTSGTSSVIATNTTAASAATATTTTIMSTNDLDSRDKSSSNTIVRASSCTALPRPRLRRTSKAEFHEEPPLLSHSSRPVAATTSTAQVSTGAAAAEALKLERRMTRGYEAWSSLAAVQVVCPGTRETFEIPPRYVLTGRLGSGAYGIVGLAKDSASGNKPVAIKKVRDAFRDAVDARRILRELRLMRMLRHPCLLSLDTCFGGYDHNNRNQGRSSHMSEKASSSSNINGEGLDEPMRTMSLENNNDMVQRNFLRGPLSDVYLVTPALDTDLHTVVFDRRVRLSNEQTAWIAYQCIAGVAHLHSRGVAHRDLKLANILVDLAECSIQICDFGLSRVLEEPGPSQRDLSDDASSDASGGRRAQCSAHGFDDKASKDVNISEGDEGEEADDEDDTSHTLYVVTRWYRAPELLLGYAGYGTAIDCWALGIVLGELLGRKPLLGGRNLRDQLERVLRLVGPLGTIPDRVPNKKTHSSTNTVNVYVENNSFSSNGSTIGNSSTENSVCNSSGGSSSGSSASGSNNCTSSDDEGTMGDEVEEEESYDPLWFVQSPRARQFVRSFYSNNRARLSSPTTSASHRPVATSTTAAATSRIAVSPDDDATARNLQQASAPSWTVRIDAAARPTETTVTPDALDEVICDNSISNSHAGTRHRHSGNSSIGTGIRRSARADALVAPQATNTACMTTVASSAVADSKISAAAKAALAAQEGEVSRVAARLLWPGIWALLPPHTPPIAVDLMGQLLMFDPKKRLKAHEALAHHWLASVREREHYEDGLDEELKLQKDCHMNSSSYCAQQRRCRSSGICLTQSRNECSSESRRDGTPVNRVYTADIEALPLTSDALRSAMQREFYLFHQAHSLDEDDGK